MGGYQEEIAWIGRAAIWNAAERLTIVQFNKFGPTIADESSYSYWY